MERREIESVLELHFHRRSLPRHIPSEQEWDDFEAYFGWKAEPIFKLFMSIVQFYFFEGGILQIACENGIRGEDTIIDAYEAEIEIGEWNINMIPFYDVGNGDYYCLSKSINDLNIYYVYHEDRHIKIVSESLEQWIKEIPNY